MVHRMRPHGWGIAAPLSGSITFSSISLLVHSSPTRRSPDAQLNSSSDTTGSGLRRTSDPSGSLLLARICALALVLLSHTATLALWRIAVCGNEDDTECRPIYSVVAQGDISAAAAEEAAAMTASAPAGAGTATKRFKKTRHYNDSAAQFVFTSMETVFFSRNFVMCI